MMQLLSGFAALSMAGTVMLSLLPEGSLKRTAGMVIGLLTIMCWAESISACLGLELPALGTGQALLPTSIHIENAMEEACTILAAQWEVSP